MYHSANKSERVSEMLRVINVETTHRPTNIVTHRTRLAEMKREEEPPMDSYRNQINLMLDSVMDVKLMRLIHDVLKAILSNR